MPASPKLLKWLRSTCEEYRYEVIAMYRRHGRHPWPLAAKNEAELESALEAGDHLLALPKEPAALANALEVSIVDFLIERLTTAGGQSVRGTERGYPDIEFHGAYFGGGYQAIDVKIANAKEAGAARQGAAEDNSEQDHALHGEHVLPVPHGKMAWLLPAVQRLFKSRRRRRPLYSRRVA